MTVKPNIKIDVTKVCFVGDKIKVFWESENADAVEMVHNGAISAVQLNGYLAFTATENETFSFIVSNREWSLESEEYKVLVYVKDHFRFPHFIYGRDVFDILEYQDFKITFKHKKHHLLPAYVMLSIPLASCIFSLLSIIVHPSWMCGIFFPFSVIWTYSSFYYIITMSRKKSSTVVNVLFCITTLTGIALIASLFRITTIESPEIRYRLTGWVCAFLIIIYLVSINNLKRIVYGKI